LPVLLSLKGADMSDDNHFAATTSTPDGAPSATSVAVASAGPVGSTGKSLGATEQSALREKVIDALRTCYDPEIPVNIYELGLVYEVKVSDAGEAHIRMTLTTPNCPAAISLPGEVEYKAKGIDGLRGVKVEVVWEPPWDMTKMTEAARLQLGMF
jgi:FeS assembly SUF system protein